MKFEAKVIRIGNSYGIRIPKGGVFFGKMVSVSIGEEDVAKPDAIKQGENNMAKFLAENPKKPVVKPLEEKFEDITYEGEGTYKPDVETTILAETGEEPPF